MSPLLKNIISVLGIVVIVGIVLFVIPKDDGATEGILPESDAVRKSARIIADTKKISQFNVSGDMLRDVRFTSLKEVKIDLVDVGTGRPNPFEAVQ